MASTVPVLFVVDCIKLLEKYGNGGSSEAPVHIHHGFKHRILYRIAPKPNAIILGNLVAHAGETLHWSALSIQSHEYSIHLVRYESQFGLMPGLEKEWYPSSYFIVDDPHQPDGPVKQVARNMYRMTCHLPSPWGVKVGKWTLSLVDNNTGQSLGHYSFEFPMEVIGHLF